MTHTKPHNKTSFPALNGNDHRFRQRRECWHHTPRGVRCRLCHTHILFCNFRYHTRKFFSWNADVNIYFLEEFLGFLRLISDHTHDKFTGIDLGSFGLFYFVSHALFGAGKLVHFLARAGLTPLRQLQLRRRKWLRKGFLLWIVHSNTIINQECESI